MADATLDPSAEAANALRTAVADYGTRSLSNPQVLANLFKDLMPTLPKEASLLVQAAEAGVPDLLAEHVGHQIPAEAAVQLTAATLGQRRALDPAACSWVASQFAAAMGYPVAVPPALGSSAAPLAAPPPPAPPAPGPAAYEAPAPPAPVGFPATAPPAPGGVAPAAPPGGDFGTTIGTPPAPAAWPAGGQATAPPPGPVGYGAGPAPAPVGYGAGPAPAPVGYGAGPAPAPVGYGAGPAPGPYGQAPGAPGPPPTGGGPVWGPQPAPRSPKGRGPLLIGGGAAAVVIIIIVAVVLASSGSSSKSPPTTLSVATTQAPTTQAPTTQPPTTEPPTTVPPNFVEIARLLPADINSGSDCQAIPQSELPNGLVGSTGALACTDKGDSSQNDPGIPNGNVFGFQFDNSADFITSLQAFNRDEGFDATASGTGQSCPPGAGFDSAQVGWHNNSYQGELECYSNRSGGPVYVWTIPAQNAIIAAVGSSSETGAQLDNWWSNFAASPGA